jgi:3D (Asp-Asp-Asp) domain-containing protein
LDVGGAIKGNDIDMAFKDHRTSSWGAGYKEIYLMDNEPE